MENELNPSNADTIVKYLTGIGGSPSESEQNFVARNVGAGVPANQAFNLVSRGVGTANTFLNPQEKSRNNEMMQLLQEMQR